MLSMPIRDSMAFLIRIRICSGMLIQKCSPSSPSVVWIAVLTPEVAALQTALLKIGFGSFSLYNTKFLEPWHLSGFSQN